MAFFGTLVPRICRLAISIAIPTERSEGGRERGERCRWQMKRPERVAGDIRRASQQGRYAESILKNVRHKVIKSIAAVATSRKIIIFDSAFLSYKPAVNLWPY